MIAVVDYGIGNLRSAEKAIIKAGGDARLVTDPGEIEIADGVVLPGVGAFGGCARALRDSGMEDAVCGAIDSGAPFLGICVGFQLLYEGSDEDDGVDGLGVLSGRVSKLDASMKLPQMQWNELKAVAGRSSEMLDSQAAGDGDGMWAYFVHSYAPVPVPYLDNVVATCDYGGMVVAAVERDNVWATQFHPEKSGTFGLAVLSRFVRKCQQAGDK
jgi:glutamine amidotransferase